MTVRLLLGATLLAAVAAAAFAQAPGPPGRGGQAPFPGRLGGPVRDNAQQPAGNAKITGRVVSAETGGPIRRAQVRLTSRDARVTRQTLTDNDGRYELGSLAAGRYRLYVSKSGYVALEYGQGRAFETGKPLDIVEGQVLDRLDFSLPRGSVITGRITDEYGDPATDVQVQTMRYQFTNGERQLVNAGRTATTDDLGQFRIFGLMPGEYLVRATMRAGSAAAAALTGNAASVTEGPVGYPVTYYPGVTDVAQAQVVSVSLGQELSSVAFSLVPARLSRISGIVMSSDGRPLGGAMVVLRATGSGGPGVRLAAGGSNQVRPDGTFRVANVPPGDYMLDVQQRPRDLQTLQNLDLSALEFASVPVSVSGDIDNLAITTTPGVAVSGRVVFQGSGASKPSPRGIQVTASSPVGQRSLMAFAGRALGGGRVNPDGTFELRGLAGPQMIRVGGLPAGWTLRSITLEGADITDTPFDFRPGANLTNVIVALTDRLSEISGTVNDSRGMPATDYTVVVFPEDARRCGSQSRYVATTRPNQNGTFSIKGLPPGPYLAAAIPALEIGTESDPSLLEKLRSRAESFSLAEGQTLVIALPLHER
jgi:5-hydroxyisourate hydrolase-like protein (transthyretin family)